MVELEPHRDAVVLALLRLGLSWDDWPEVVADEGLTGEERLSAALLLLAGVRDDEASPYDLTATSAFEDDQLDWLLRARRPWDLLGRVRLPWTPETATTALRLVTDARVFDDRATRLALRGAREVCDAGTATVDVVDAVRRCIESLDRTADHLWGVVEMRNLARRVLASATPPDLLDLSLLGEGDAWAGPAREVARSLSADEVASLVRLLGGLGPRKPSARWFRSVGEALGSEDARDLLRQWLELAAVTDIVPCLPGSQLGYVPGALFVGTNVDVVRAAVWATTRLPDETWPAELLGALARRGAAHNGLAGFPEALALKVATASVDALALRGGPTDMVVLRELREDLRRQDLLKKVDAALG